MTLLRLLVVCLLTFCWGCTKDGEKIVFDSGADTATDVIVDDVVEPVDVSVDDVIEQDTMTDATDAADATLDD